MAICKDFLLQIVLVSAARDSTAPWVLSTRLGFDVHQDDLVRRPISFLFLSNSISFYFGLLHDVIFICSVFVFMIANNFCDRFRIWDICLSLYWDLLPRVLLPRRIHITNASSVRCWPFGHIWFCFAYYPRSAPYWLYHYRGWRWKCCSI